MAESSSDLCMHGDLNGVVVEDSEDSSGWADSVRETDILADLVPVSEGVEKMKRPKRLRTNRRGESSNESWIDIYLRPVDTTNVGYVPLATAHADPDPKVQERLENLASMWLPLYKKSR
ncbi:unnamed protein product [Cuscuta epithymum]|uniref:Uncharacterized protein n=1 Tax=Cuscuta epithymum TaxID=186058 RepID=A0AAV0C7U6_9ASTE|nr:unnamed protein product [Cuscuta epithymum]CAH9068452.1 unnamed protein product [Cuscuta epithymum]